MVLRCNRRKKDGKAHDYWSVVENRRCSDGRVVQRQVLYLGEINASQREAWRKTIELQDAGTRRQVALFPAGRVPVDDVDAIGVRLSELSLRRPRQWGACWLALQLWQQLELDSFWRARLARAQGNTPWLNVLKTPVAYRLIDPGSEWRLPRQGFDSSAMADLLESGIALAEKNTLSRHATSQDTANAACARTPNHLPGTPVAPLLVAGRRRPGARSLGGWSCTDRRVSLDAPDHLPSPAGRPADSDEPRQWVGHSPSNSIREWPVAVVLPIFDKHGPTMPSQPCSDGESLWPTRSFLNDPAADETPDRIRVLRRFF